MPSKKREPRTTRKAKQRNAKTTKMKKLLAPQAAAWTGPFRFLDLPPEIRCRIYGYLVPTAEFVPADGIQTKRLRRDGQHCTPGVLATNRQIHDEVKKEWYSTTPYEVKIDPIGTHFLGTRVESLDENLDPRLGWIRNMRLVVALNPYDPNQLDRSESRLPEVSGVYSPVIQSLIQHLLSLPDLRLQYIDLVVAMNSEDYIAHLWGKKDSKTKVENLLTVLHHNFDADFLKLKGVAIWRSWEFDYSQPVNTRFLPRDRHESRKIKENGIKFEEIAIPYFEQLAKRINPPKTEFMYLGKVGGEATMTQADLDRVIEMMDPYW